MTYFKVLVLGFLALTFSAPAQAALKAKDTAVGRLTLVKRKIPLDFKECTESHRNNDSYQCTFTYKGSKPYEALVNGPDLNSSYTLKIDLNETYSATAALYPGANGTIVFQFYAMAQGTGGTALRPTSPLSDEAIRQVMEAYVAAKELTVLEFYVQTVR